MDFLKVGVCNVRVDLRGRDVAMAEHGLYASEVSSVHKEVRGK